LALARNWLGLTTWVERCHGRVWSEPRANLDLGALWLLVNGLEWPPTAGSVPAVLVGLAARFAGCKRFAFNDRSRRAPREGGEFRLGRSGRAPRTHSLTSSSPRGDWT